MDVEKQESEDWIAGQLERKGWKYVNPSTLVPDKRQPLSLPRLTKALKKLNAVSDQEIKEVVNYLTTRSFEREGCKQVLNLLKNGYATKNENGDIKHIKLFDFKDPDQNEFVYSRQVYYAGLKEDIPDVVLYVNGIPLVMIECKRMSKSWKDAYAQIKRYESEVPETFKYVQFSIAIGDKIAYFPNVKWVSDVAGHKWRDDPIEPLDHSVLLDVLRNFIFFREVEGEITKVLPRYMQYRAVNKVVEVATTYALDKAKRNKGLIWHWQGSGKTLEMLFAAYKLKQLLGNPSIFLVVDRLDLEKQLSDELKALYPVIGYERIASAADLKQVLTHADGKRGVFLTLIHKFRHELEDLLDKIGKGEWSISQRKDVIAFIDEGHRTQYGDLASMMRAILKSASFFAFTGTPIAKRERDTYSRFGYADQPYLDRYFILDSISDGFTVKIAWQSRPDIEGLDKESLNAFLNSELEEIPEDLRTRVKDNLSARLNKAKVILEGEARIEKVARDIASHYLNYVKPFKAMVVAVDRLACVRYKRALDKFLDPETSEIIMTFEQNETEKEIQQFREEWTQRYREKDDKKRREKIIEDFKKESSPLRILIVTDMLLTGFDAPILQTMYLDKPLKEHRLLQAIARTNRPFNKNGENIKPAGMIVDYVRVFTELGKALAIYNEPDIEGAVYDLDNLKEELQKKIDKAIKIFDDISHTFDRDTIEAAIIKLEQESKAEDFGKLYRQIRNLYRFLLEDRHQFKKTFSWLTEVYFAYSRRINGVDPEVEQKSDKFLSDAMRFIQQSIDVDKIRKDFPIVEVDEQFLKSIEKQKDKKRKFYDLLFAVQNYIYKTDSFGREDLVERVNNIVERWKQKEEDLEQIYGELLPIAKSLEQEESERKKLGLDRVHYEIYLTIKQHTGIDADETLAGVKQLMKEIANLAFPGWWEKKDVRNKMAQRILLFLIDNYGDKVDARKLRKTIMRYLEVARWTS